VFYWSQTKWLLWIGDKLHTYPSIWHDVIVILYVHPNKSSVHFSLCNEIVMLLRKIVVTRYANREQHSLVAGNSAGRYNYSSSIVSCLHFNLKKCFYGRASWNIYFVLFSVLNVWIVSTRSGGASAVLRIYTHRASSILFCLQVIDRTLQEVV
jgi:hypothetical protein